MESKGKEKRRENRTAGTNGSPGKAFRRFSGVLRMLVPVLIFSMVFCFSCGHVPGEHADPGGSSADPYGESRPEKDEPETKGERKGVVIDLKDTDGNEKGISSRLAKPYYMAPIAMNSWPRPEGWDDKDSENAMSFVMIHFSSDVVEHPENPYDLDRIKQIYTDGGASVHYVIDREGVIWCFIPESRTAWHAGKGKWKDIEKLENRMNFYSVGIELLAMGSEYDMSLYISKEKYESLPKKLLGYTEAQYVSLKALVDDICSRYAIPVDREHVIGHEEYAPDRKRDPGQLFDWSRIVP